MTRMFFSPSTRGFYAVDVHGSNMPQDAVEITDEKHAALLAGNAEGKQIASDAFGCPILDDLPKPTYAQLRADEYPSIRDQLDAIWKGGYAMEEMRDKVKAIKTKYPKG